jgi:hypothetical protein
LNENVATERVALGFHLCWNLGKKFGKSEGSCVE